jgi:hypothetical protein
MKNNNSASLAGWRVTLITIAVGLTTVSGQSLWIDEANSAYKAIQPTIQSFWRLLVQEQGSDLQMPLYHLYLWLWVKIAGHNEWQLRAANLPWFFVALWVWWRGMARFPGIRFTGWALCLLHPMVWQYLDEARPYMMQFSAGLGLVVWTARGWETREWLNRPVAWWFFVLTLFVMAGASLLGLVCGLIYLAMVWKFFSGKKRIVITRQTLTPMLCGAIAVVGLGAYYGWTLLIGARGSAIAVTSWKNLVFVDYELMGLSGLGPDRLTLRELGMEAFRNGLWILPLLAGVIVIAILVYYFVSKPKLEAMEGHFIAYLIIASVVLAGLAWFAHFRLLGRHLMPVLPAAIFVLASAMEHLQKTPLRYGPVAVLSAFWLFSALTLRFDPKHSKDNYRAAAAAARYAADRGKSVWWLADAAAAEYYKVQAPRYINRSVLELASEKMPDLIILSRPDIYDPARTVRTYAESYGYREDNTLKAFTLYRRKTD